MQSEYDVNAMQIEYKCIKYILIGKEDKEKDMGKILCVITNIEIIFSMVLIRKSDSC